MSKEPSGWFVRRTDNDMLRCTDGKWRHNAGAVENIKIWKHVGNALRYGQRGVPDQGELGGVPFPKVIAYAVYGDDPIDCFGRNKSGLTLEALTHQPPELDMVY